MDFTATAVQVLSMMAYAVPGYLFVKTKALSPAQITPFSKVLVYLCQPCLQFSALLSADVSAGLLREMGLFFLLCTGVQLLMFLLGFLVLRDRRAVGTRVCNVACVMGNVGFIGIPLLQALLPAEEVANGTALAAVFGLSMNFLAWTIGLFTMTGKKKHIRLKGILLNPAMLTFFAAFPLFLIGFKLPQALDTTVSLAGRMSTPLCMIALGMRLAATPFKRIVTDKFAWVACVGKLVVMPLVALAAVKLLPLPSYFVAALFLLSCCPTASVVQNFSEIYLSDEEGKHTAADGILLSNLLCMVTVPLLAMLL